jgi:mRNA-degrading endonuclease HigB of HigAB toxin-antitoxin module
MEIIKYNELNNRKTIIKYISKGGKFKAPEDLKKIWGLNPSMVKDLMPFVKIISIQKNKFADNVPYWHLQNLLLRTKE